MTTYDTDVKKEIEKLQNLGEECKSSRHLDSKYLEVVEKVCDKARGPWNFDPSKKLKSEKEMCDLGKNDGRKGLPDTEQTNLTDNEQKIYQWCKSWRDDFVSNMIEPLRDLLGVIIKKSEAQLERYKAACEADSEKQKNYYQVEIDREERFLTEKARGSEDPLLHLQEAFQTKLNDFRDFQESHGLNRRPSYDSGVLIFLTIFACIAVEAVFNAYFYAKGSEGGLIGGLFVALGVSVIICGSGFVAGFCFRWHSAKKRIEDKWEKSIIKQLLSYIGSLVFVALAVIFIAIASVYRDEASLIALTGEIPLFSEIRDPLWERVKVLDIIPKADIEGLFLILVNFVVAFLGAWKGYFSFDPVPDYAKTAKALKKARKEYKDEISKEEKRLNLGDSNKEGSIKGIKVPDPAFLDKLVELYGTSFRVYGTLNKAANEEIQNNISKKWCNARLEAYRIGNKDARPATSPAPDYFKIYPSFEDLDENRDKRRTAISIDTNKIYEDLQRHYNEALIKVEELRGTVYKKRIGQHKNYSKEYHEERNENEE